MAESESSGGKRIFGSPGRTLLSLEFDTSEALAETFGSLVEPEARRKIGKTTLRVVAKRITYDLSRYTRIMDPDVMSRYVEYINGIRKLSGNFPIQPDVHFMTDRRSNLLAVMALRELPYGGSATILRPPFYGPDDTQVFATAIVPNGILLTDPDDLESAKEHVAENIGDSESGIRRLSERARTLSLENIRVVHIPHAYTPPSEQPDSENP